MEETYPSCKHEGNLFTACLEKHKYVPPCGELIVAFDRCVEAYFQKLSKEPSKVSSQPNQKNARDMGNPVSQELPSERR